MTSYHGWTHAPKEQGGTDPIPFPEVTEMPWARAEKTFSSTLQAIPQNSNTIVVWTNYHNIAAGESGEGVFADNDVSNQDLDVLEGGIYLVKIFISWATTGVGNFRAGVSKQAGFVDWIMERNTSLFGGQTEFSETTLMHYDPDAGATGFSVVLFHSSGADRNLDAAFLHAVRLGDYTGLHWWEMNPDQS